MKQLTAGEIITSVISGINVEFSKGEEVAEFGEYAPSTKVFTVPVQLFEMSKERLIENLKKKAEREGFDTVVIQKESYEEEVFHLVEKGGA